MFCSLRVRKYYRVFGNIVPLVNIFFARQVGDSCISCLPKDYQELRADVSPIGAIGFQLVVRQLCADLLVEGSYKP